MSQILVDTSVWVDHFRQANQPLVDLLLQDRVLVHPVVIGELACGTPPDRGNTLGHLRALKSPLQATIPEVLQFIEREHLFGQGCGLVDLILLASTLITPDARLWTLDKRLAGLADRFGVCHPAPVHGNPKAR